MGESSASSGPSTCEHCGQEHGGAERFCPDTGKLIVSSIFPPGTLLEGKYRISRTLGVGGMGAVFEAVHTDGAEHFRNLVGTRAEMAAGESVTGSMEKNRGIHVQIPLGVALGCRWADSETKAVA